MQRGLGITDPDLNVGIWVKDSLTAKGSFAVFRKTSLSTEGRVYL